MYVPYDQPNARRYAGRHLVLRRAARQKKKKKNGVCAHPRTHRHTTPPRQVSSSPLPAHTAKGIIPLKSVSGQHGWYVWR